MYARHVNNVWVAWNGELVSKVVGDHTEEFRLNINDAPALSPDELAAFGLFIVQEAAIPDGKVVISTTLQDVGGQPVAACTYADPTPPDALSRRQFMLQLHISGLFANVSAWVNQQDVLVQVAFNESGSFVRSEPTLQAGFMALGFTSAQQDAFWLAGSKL